VPGLPQPLSGADPAPGTRVRAAVDWCLIALGLVLFAACLEFRVTSDGDQRFRDLQALLERGAISPEPYSLVAPLGATPLFLLGRVARSARFWCARYNFLIFVAGLAVLYRLVSRVDRATARTLVLVLMTASMFPHHIRDFFGEVFTAVLGAVGIIAIGIGARLKPGTTPDGRPRPETTAGVTSGVGNASGWAAFVLAVVNTPSWLLGLTLVAFSEVWRRRRLRYLLAAVAALALVLSENAIRRGDPLVSGYEHARGFQTVLPYSGREGFSYPLAFGVLSILFSFGKGLVFYAPGLLLPVRGPLARPQRLLLVVVGSLVIVYARWWAWYGGWFWGPRFFLIASVPAALALAVQVSLPSRRAALNVLALALLAWSTWVAIDGVIFEQYGLDRCFDNNRYQWEFLCWYVPELSAVFRPFVVMKPLVAADLLIAGYFLAVFAWLAAPLASALAATSGAVLSDVRAAWQRGPSLRF
jgi:hypothetical protein